MPQKKNLKLSPHFTRPNCIRTQKNIGSPTRLWREPCFNFERRKFFNPNHMYLNWKINLYIIVGLIILQSILLGTALGNDDSTLSITYFLQILFLYPLYSLMKEKHKVARIGLPLTIGIWLLLINGFSWLAHCVGGCSSNFIINSFPISALLLSISIFIYAFKKNYMTYLLIGLLCIFLLSIFTPFMTNGRNFIPFFY